MQTRTFKLFKNMDVWHVLSLKMAKRLRQILMPILLLVAKMIMLHYVLCQITELWSFFHQLISTEVEVDDCTSSVQEMGWAIKVHKPKTRFREDQKVFTG